MAPFRKYNRIWSKPTSSEQTEDGAGTAFFCEYTSNQAGFQLNYYNLAF